jgi:hypothetical protein
MTTPNHPMGTKPESFTYKEEKVKNVIAVKKVKVEGVGRRSGVRVLLEPCSRHFSIVGLICPRSVVRLGAADLREENRVEFECWVFP